MKNLAFAIAVFLAAIGIHNHAHGQPVNPPGPVPTTCAGGQSVTTYAGYGAPLTCGGTGTTTTDAGSSPQIAQYVGASTTHLTPVAVTGTGSGVLATSPTLTSPTINGGTLTGTLAGTPTLSGNLTFAGRPIFSGTLTGTQTACLGLDASNNLTVSAAACGAGGAGVTSVGLSVPATSIFGVTGSPVTTSGTLGLTTTGTSGGIPYFSSGTQLATTAALTAGLPVIGGGTGVAPSVGTKSGNTNDFVTTTGALTTGHCAQWDANGNAIDSGGACGGAGGVSVTAGTPSIVITPSPGTGTFTVGNTQAIADLSASGQAIVTGDNTQLVKLGAFTYTLAQAGSAGFLSGWSVVVQNYGATNATINATTSTFTGLGNTPSSSLVLVPGAWAALTSDGTNYLTDASYNYVPGSNVTITRQGNGTTQIAATGGGGAATIVAPQGRLSLTSGTPVMISDIASTSQVFYDNYVGNQVPYYTGSADALDTIASGEVSLIMQTTGTGVTNLGGVFDIWWEGNTNHNICVATNGTGGGWASDTGGSNTARGTGYSQIDFVTRSYMTNKNAVANCYNGTTNYGSIAVNKLTYLGTLYTTAAGKTTMQFVPAAAAGGSNNCMCLWNAHHREVMVTIEQDSNTSWPVNTASTWEALDQGASSNFNNRITYVDGLGRSSVSSSLAVLITNSITHSMYIGINRDATSGGPANGNAAAAQFGSATTAVANQSTPGTFVPAIGVHFLQAMEWADTTSAASANFGIGMQFNARIAN